MNFFEGLTDNIALYSITRPFLLQVAHTTVNYVSNNFYFAQIYS